MTTNLWNYPADLWPHLAAMEARRDQLARDYRESQWKGGPRWSAPSWLLTLLRPRRRSEPSGDPHLRQSVVLDTDEDEDHICCGENLRPPSGPKDQPVACSV